MTVPREVVAEILRLHHAEQWPLGTIARQLCLHHSVVSRVIETDGIPKPRTARASKLDDYVPFVQDVLRRYPKLTASRLHRMCRDRGLQISEVHFRRLVAKLRPRPNAEAYLRLKTLKGEQAQVDWGHFPKIKIGRASRTLLAFVLVLSYSRRLYLRFFLSASTENFLRGHEAAFAKWGGCPRICLYDNLKSVVLERKGAAIRFNPLLLSFAGHYHFEPRPVAPYRGNEKGRVERGIRYIRDAFFAGREYVDLADLNAQADAWCDTDALDRPWPEDKTKTVREAFEEERPSLLPLPGDAFPTDERVEVKISKTPYARFDGNDYSVPHTWVRREATIHASEDRVRILCAGEVIAEHLRSYSKGEQIEEPGHIEALAAMKHEASKHRGYDRLHRAAPATRDLLEKVAERGANLGSVTWQLLQLLDEYGDRDLQGAVQQALEREVFDPHSVRMILDRERRAAGAPPPIPVRLPEDPRIRDLSVASTDLANYDNITGPADTDDDGQELEGDHE